MNIRIAIGILLGFACVGCHSSPTEPEGSFVSVDGYLTNADGIPTIQQWQPFFDGQSMSIPGTSSPPSSSIHFIGSVIQATLRGHHTFSLTVTAQTTSPSRYRASSVRLLLTKTVGYSPQQLVDTVTLPDQTVSVSTGSSITFTFDH